MAKGGHVSVPDEDTKRIGRLLHYVGMLVAVVCGTVGYALAYAPTTKSIEDTNALLDELRQSVQNAPVIRREHDRASRYLEKVTQRLAALRRRVPAEAEAGDFLRQVTEIAARQHVTISNFQPGKTTQRNGYAEMEVTLSGKGSFENICSFFDGLGKLPRLSKVETLTISAGDTPREYPMKATLLIYFGLQDADATPPKEVRRG
jgi:Tfp pilus assembly protein PilO